jgi:hypothetical protein
MDKAGQQLQCHFTVGVAAQSCNAGMGCSTVSQNKPSMQSSMTANLAQSCKGISRHQQAWNVLERESLDVVNDMLHPMFACISVLPLPVKLLMLPARLHPLLCAQHLISGTDGKLGLALNLTRPALLAAATASLPHVAGLDWLEVSGETNYQHGCFNQRITNLCAILRGLAEKPSLTSLAIVWRFRQLPREPMGLAAEADALIGDALAQITQLTSLKLSGQLARALTCCLPMSAQDAYLASGAVSHMSRSGEQPSMKLCGSGCMPRLCMLARLELVWGECSISPQALRALLPCCPQLTHLAGAPDSSAPAPDSLPNLRTLNVAFMNRPHHARLLQSQNLVKWLAAAPVLVHLCLSQACIAGIPAALNWSLQLRALSSLDLTSLELIGEDQCQAIASLTSLTSLRVITGNVSDLYSHLCHLSHLCTLVLCSPLPASPSLRKLPKQAFAHMTALSCLQLGRADFGDSPEHKRHLEGIPRLEVHLPAPVPDAEAEVEEEMAEALEQSLHGLPWRQVQYVAIRGNPWEIHKLLSPLCRGVCGQLKLLYMRLYGADLPNNLFERLPLLQWLDCDTRLAACHSAVLTRLTSLSLSDNVSGGAAYEPCSALVMLTSLRELHLQSLSHAFSLHSILPAFPALQALTMLKLEAPCPLAIPPLLQGAAASTEVDSHPTLIKCNAEDLQLAKTRPLGLPPCLRRLSIKADRHEDVVCSNMSNGFQQTVPWLLPALLNDITRLTALSNLQVAETFINAQERFNLFVTLRDTKVLCVLELDFLYHCKQGSAIHHECGQLTKNDLDVLRWSLKGMRTLEAVKLSCACDSRYLAMDMEPELQQNLPEVCVAVSARTADDPWL